MILRIILFLSYGMLVSSNNGYPIIPAQTYPIYQQNGYSNPPANQPSDIASYLQSLMAQNQSPTLDLSPSSIKQLLLNRLLSGQPAQASFDQNSRVYGSNFFEFPNHAIAPNAVNSYFAAPTAINQPTEVINNDRSEDTKSNVKRKKNKKRKSKSSRSHNESEKNSKNSNKTKIDDTVQENDGEISKKSKRRSRKPKTEETSKGTRTKNNESEDGKKPKKRKRKHKEDEVTNIVEEENKENPKPRRRHKKKPKSDKDNTDKVDLEPTKIKSKQIQEGINVAHFNEGIVAENRFVRNPIPEKDDLIKPIPNLRENIANSFKGLPQFNNPAMSSFFANFENIYQTMMTNSKGTNEHTGIKRKPPARNKNTVKKKVRVKNKNSTATALPKKSTVTPKVNIIPKEETIIIQEKPRENVDPTEDSKSSNEPSEINETRDELENIENEENVETIDEPVNNYEGYIEDYYPLFTDSEAYTANNREVFVKNLSDTKYFYAVDKRNPEVIKKMRFESFSLPERVVKEYDVNKKYDDTEQEAIKNAVELEASDNEKMIKFCCPPPLEKPDFTTRQIDRSEIDLGYYNFNDNDDYDPIYVTNKASYYSEAKIPHYPGLKENSKKIQKDKPKGVETVFARSKVVTYSPVYKPEEEEDSISAASSHQILTDDSFFKDGGTTYVLASTLD